MKSPLKLLFNFLRHCPFVAALLLSLQMPWTRTALAGQKLMLGPLAPDTAVSPGKQGRQ